MAIVQYSALVNQIRGKLNGSTLSRNRSVNTLYRKGQPTRAATQKQTERRSVFSTVQRLWKTLTPALRTDYEEAAHNNPTTDRFGNPVTLTGYQHYMKVNIPSFPLFESIWDPIFTQSADPVPEFSITYQEIIPIGLGNNRFVMRYTATLAVPVSDPNIYAIFKISKPLSPGQSKYYGSFIFIGWIDGLQSGTYYGQIPLEEYPWDPYSEFSIIGHIDFYRKNEGVRLFRSEYRQET